MQKRTILAVCALGALTLLKCQPIEPIVVMGHSMEPTFEPHQLLWATRDFNELRRGDIVVFDHNGERMIKRVEGLPGDVVHQYYICGDWIELSYSVWNRLPRKETYPKRTTTVPEGTVYVVGDNVDKSLDSRTYGAVAIQDIEAKVLYQNSEVGRLPGIMFSHKMAIKRAKYSNA